MDRTHPAPDDHLESESQLLAPSISISRNPSRRKQLTDNEINPLLFNLSPSSTLKALAATGALPVEESERWDSLEHSVVLASASERAWAIKVSLARQKLIKWHEELSSWPWSRKHPNGFEKPASAHREEYWGGVSGRLALYYEERVETIKDDMETLEVEDMKNYVRNMYHVGTYEHLSDLTSLMTGEIVQSLPTLSRLTSLLRDWTNRLLILRQVPVFLRDLDASNKSMISAWVAIGKHDDSAAIQRQNFTREAFLQIQAALQDQISQLARRIDNMLDLDERDELPPQWADRMDELEVEYSEWVVQAQELVLDNEMHFESKELAATSNEIQLSSEAGLPLDMSHAIGLDAQVDGVEQGSDSQFDQARHTPGHDVPDEANSNPFAGQQKFDTAPLGGSLPGSSEDTPSKTSLNQSSDPFLEQGGSNAMDRLTQPDPSGQLETHRSTVDLVRDPAVENSRGIPGPGVGAKLESHVDGFNISPTLSHRRAHKPSPLVLDKAPESTASSEISSDISTPGSATSDYFSNKSSPEIRDASVVEFLGSPILKSPRWSSNEPITPLDIVSRQSSQRTERGDNRLSQMGSWSGFASPVSQRSRASTFVPEPSVIETQEPPESENRHTPWQRGHVRTRSASMQSFEVVPKSEIRKIMVRRSESYSSSPGTSSIVPTLTSQQSQERILQEHAVPETDQKLDEPDKHDSDSSEPISLPKARETYKEASDLDPGPVGATIGQTESVGPFSIVPTSTTSSTTFSGHKSSQSVEDQLEARISSILTSIPAHIRLTSGPEPDAPEVSSFSSSGPKTPASRASAGRLNRALTSSPTMTLAPAQPKTKSKSQNGEPEIKLYHLHQAGKDVPIKLFVRLVGESGERVMVRIGGGWADLAAYLKEYASHHGRRSVSDSRFEIQGLPSSPLASQISPSSRPATPSSGPTSTLGMRRQHTASAQFERPQTPNSDPFRPSSRSSLTTEEVSPSLGLAGPKTKKLEISPRKQAWVDEMLDQARQGGDIGKVGATKRVFMKSKMEGPLNRD